MTKRPRHRARPAIELVSFRWPRHAPGAYVERRRRAFEGPAEAASGLAPEIPWLVSTDDGRASYDPFRKEPSLFRRFADLPPTDDNAILAFATEFGVLGIPEMSVVEHDGVDQLVLAEPVDVWTHEIRAMKHAVDLFDAAQARDHERLGQWITVDSEGVFTYRRNDALGGHQIGAGGALAKVRGQKRVVILVARRLLRREFINVRLEEYVHLLLVPRLRAVPKHLLGALWLQLARADDGNIDYRRCEWAPCQKWIEITRTFDGHTKAARFCCDAHRVYAHKKRNPKPKRGRKA